MKNVLGLILFALSCVYSNDKEWVNAELRLLFVEGELSESEYLNYLELSNDLRHHCQEISEVVLSVDCEIHEGQKNKFRTHWRGEGQGPEFRNLNWEAGWGSLTNKGKLEKKDSSWLISDYSLEFKSQFVNLELGDLDQRHKMIHWKKQGAKKSLSESKFSIEQSDYSGGRVEVWQSPQRRQKVILESNFYHLKLDSNESSLLQNRSLWSFESALKEGLFVRLGMDGLWHTSELWNFLELESGSHNLGVRVYNKNKFFSFWQYKPKKILKESNGRFSVKMGKGQHDWMWLEKLGSENLDSLFWMRLKGWVTQSVGKFKINNKAQLWTSSDSTWFRLDNINSYKFSGLQLKSYLEQNNESASPKVSGSVEWIKKKESDRWMFGTRFVAKPFESQSEWANAHKLWLRRKSKGVSMELAGKFCSVVSSCEGVLLSQKTQLSLLENQELKVKVHIKGVWEDSDFIEPVIYLGLDWHFRAMNSY